MKKLTNLFTKVGTDGLTEDEREAIRRKAEEEAIRVKAELFDTDEGASNFRNDDDEEVYFGDREVKCAHLMGDKAVAEYIAAVEAQEARRNAAVANALMKDVGDLEIKDGAAHKEGDEVPDVTFDPWRYERNRQT